MTDQILTELKLPYPDGSERRVRVYTPHRMPGQEFPVIYMTDGCNLFDEETSSFGCWHTREAVWEEQKTTGRAAVIVGIHNDGDIERANELTPKSIGRVLCPDEYKQELNPTGEVFADFVINTVMPVIEKYFPVKTGRENTAFCGSSMGGLMAFFAALNRPDVYSFAGVFSPAFQVYPIEDIKNWIIGKLRPDMPYLYIYTGAGDELEKQIFDRTEAVYDFLVECYPPDKHSEVVVPENKHHESAWEPIFKDFLHTFLSKTP